MNTELHTRRWAVATLLTAGLWPATAAHAGVAMHSIEERRPVPADGQIEVINVSGSVRVIGWDRAELEVTGRVGTDVERVDIATSGTHTTVRVVRSTAASLGFHFSDPADAELVIHVPQHNSLRASLVSADVSVKDLDGAQELQTVSGDVSTTALHECHVRTVSGDVHIDSGPDVKVLEIATVSGDLHLTGSATGELSISTVSGDGMVSVGSLSRARLKTVSGDFHLNAGLVADGRLEVESVSGDLTVDFSGAPPPAEFDLQSSSGDLSACFGPKASAERFGPGSRLVFKEGAGTARVRVDTRSGDVTLCTRK